MHSSIFIATLLGSVAWAAPAPTGNTELSGRSDQHGSLVARTNYVECHQNCVRGCPGAWICQATCNVACANAGEADHEAAALAARDAVVAATKSVAVREESHDLVARTDFAECHRKCLGGCGGLTCPYVCNVACSNAADAETAAITAREAVTAATKSVATREETHGLVARSNYVECHQNCVRGCPGAWICQATCNVACANAAEPETAAIVAREFVVAATKSVAVREETHGLVARSNYVECHQNCVRGCPGAWICQATCNVACANAGEGVADETRSLAAGEDGAPALTAPEA